MDTKKVQKVEVYDYTKDGGGVVFDKWKAGMVVEVVLENDGKTLKVIVS